MSRETVYKYPIPLTDEFSLKMPEGSIILTVQTQRGAPCIWARVFPDAERTVTRHFRLAGTGHPLSGRLEYIGTFQLNDGGLVFHLFEEISG